MKKYLITALSILPMLAISLPANKVTKAILKLTHNQTVIEKSFPSVAGFTGYLVKPKKAGRTLIVYASKNQQYLFIGNLITLSGKNLSSEYAEKYINVKLAKKASKTIYTQTHYFTQGVNSAPHKMYVFFDPNCSACHMLYKTISPLISSGKLQVRFAPVAFLRPSSAGKAAHIMSGASDQEKAALLKEDEARFNMSTESGSIKPLKNNEKNAKLFAIVAKNTAYFTTQGFYATPTIIYTMPNGKPGIYTGAIASGKPLSEFLAKVGKSF